jgi:hypothetical protein
MKIAILIPSRHRPRRLSAVITTLQELSSGDHEIEYRVGYDWDDTETRNACEDIPGARTQCIPGSVLTIGTIWNFLAYPERADADIYSCMIDDAFPLTPHWDKIMVAMAEKYPAFSWFEVSAPTNVGYPTCTKEWLKKIKYIVPEHFPFWFSDTWFCEMVQFTGNTPVPMTQQLSLYSKQETTQNLRDLDFWWGFFNATRKVRLNEAFRIVTESAPFEQFVASRKRFIDATNARDAEFRGKRIEQLEKERGSTAEPSAKYLLAKSAAEKYLKDNGLTIWCGLDKC